MAKDNSHNKTGKDKILASEFDHFRQKPAVKRMARVAAFALGGIVILWSGKYLFRIMAGTIRAFKDFKASIKEGTPCN